ncbi:hypothetical protein N9Y92_03835 [Chlamydiales bacterium]|nr:hypothetical protein [Chlamydiales bacterium]
MPIEPFYITHKNLYIVPFIPYAVECCPYVYRAIHELNPDCVAVDLPFPIEKGCIEATMRLPEPTAIQCGSKDKILLAELIDPAFEGLRRGMEKGIHLRCLLPSLDTKLPFSNPDPYAIQRLGLKSYFEAFPQVKGSSFIAKELKELTLRHEKVLWIAQMPHIHSILAQIDQDTFEKGTPEKIAYSLGALSEKSLREVPQGYGFLAQKYEESRGDTYPDRQKWTLELIQAAKALYIEKTESHFPSYHIRNLMKFLRNWSLQRNQLQPELYQILIAAKACVDDIFALAAWELATNFPFQSNVDNLPILDIKPEDVWGNQKTVKFRPKQKGRKSALFSRKNRTDPAFKFEAPSPFNICSYQPEDGIIENFAEFLKKKGSQILIEEGARTAPFSGSLEDGIDVKETIRHWPERQLYIKSSGRPPGGVGSVVLIFDEDEKNQKYPWHTTWLGEHNQESDMAFYATSMQEQIVGPGISRCEYGGFMMSYPPRRLYDIWRDPDYLNLNSKSEILLMAAIDYSPLPLVVYSAERPPRSFFKNYAARYNKKLVYYPIGQISPLTRNKIRTFHVLGGHDKRNIADEYIL